MDALTQYVVLTSATVTGSVAVYVGSVARRFAGTVEANEERSKGNERALYGEDHYPGVVERLEAVEGGESA